MKVFNLLFAGIIALAIFTSATQLESSKGSIISYKQAISLGEYQDVSAIEFKKLINENKYILIDVRTVKEFKAGHIEGAINIDWYQRTFETKIQEFDKTKSILIYCRSGNRTSKTKFAMLGMGFQKVINLKNGVNDWARNGFRFVK